MKFITLAFFLFSLNATCEYRVYQYYVHSKIKNLNPLTPTLVTSTLDPKSYIAYHGGNDSIEINLLRSWMCLGNTSHNSPCTISDGLELQESMKK